MNLRCVFHVSPATRSAQSPPARAAMSTLIDVDIDFVDDAPPRGRSFETWSRARGWASEPLI
jgi:hypothetical protein